jgi:hypothetical protein
MSQPRGQDVNPSARFVRGELEEASRLAAVKLSQDEAASDTTSVSSVAWPPTPHAGAEARARDSDAVSEARDELPGVRRNITAVVGNTPCVFLSEAVTAGCVATVVAKLESSEPCCSVKDRCVAQARVSLLLLCFTMHFWQRCRRFLLPRHTSVAGACMLKSCVLTQHASRTRRSIGVAMIDAAEAEGKIQPGVTTLVEPTSGARPHTPPARPA